MNTDQAKAILTDVQFPGFNFELHGDFTGMTYLVAIFAAPDADGQKGWLPQTSRKWLLSKHMVKSELVQTAFLCVLTCLEHEAREQFKFKGARVFGPHFDVDRLVQLCNQDATEVRP